MKERITFFENIFYWLWWYLLKLSKRWYTPPHSLACGLLSALKVINFFWIIMLLGAILKNNILITILGDATIGIVLGALVIGFFLIRNDEKNYEEKADQIAGKFEFLNRKERLKKKGIFFVYVIISLGVWSIADTLVAMYS